MVVVCAVDAQSEVVGLVVGLVAGLVAVQLVAKGPVLLALNGPGEPDEGDAVQQAQAVRTWLIMELRQ